MDPLTAIGLASNVLSFVQFASELIQASTEIRNSAGGCTAEVAALDEVYTRLQNLSSGLQSSQQCKLEAAENLSDELYDGNIEHMERQRRNEAATALRNLAKQCESDCNELLGATAKLRVESPSAGKWRSFQAALRKVLEKDKIAALEGRLQRAQTTMTLHVCTIIGYHLMQYSDDIRKLQRQGEKMHADQDSSFRNITDTMVSIRQQLQDSEDQPSEAPHTLQSLDVLQKQFRQMSISEEHVTKQQSVLKNLTFESRPVRHDSIAEAHQQTFAWALQTTSGDDRGIMASNHNSKLGDWLRAGHGIFWVSGKPGSGKSTLMKFVANERRTLELLSQWSSPGKAIIASHYFWNAGTPFQKSYQGLLRGLLYEIFRLCPRLISIGCPDRWSHPETDLAWPISYLHASLSRVFNSAHLENLSFCVFIDGLDEFDGDHLQLCQILSNLANSKWVKFCVSSRPWNVFDDAFGHSALKIYVHDLTKADITNFSRSRLQDHPRWSSVNVGGQGEWLISEISERAWGVFLWAFLVTKLLREGLTNRDRFSDLHRRLISFPVELEDFFAQILESIEPFYRSKMATTLQIAVAAHEPLDYIIYDWHDKEYDDENYATKMPISPLSASEISEIRDIAVFRLESRTRGLLELREGQEQVTFLHRTVKDFLDTKKVADALAQNVMPGLKFCARKSILKAHLACLKSLPDAEFDISKTLSQSCADYKQRGWHSTETWTANSNVLRLVNRLLCYAAFIDVETFSGYDQDLDTILDEVDSVMARRVTGAKQESFFRTELVLFGVFNFLCRKLEKDARFVPTHDHSTVKHLILPESPLAKDHTHLYQLGIRIFGILLESGQLVANQADSNSLTVWSALLRCLISADVRASGREPALLLDLFGDGIIQSLVRQRPDPRAKTSGSASDTSVAWGVYLGLAFKIPSNPAVERSYLYSLEELLRADGGLSPTAFGIRSCIYHNFLDPLAKVSWGRKTENNLPLLKNVADILLRLITRLEMDEFIGPIEEAVCLLRDKCTSNRTTNIKRKRRADDRETRNTSGQVRRRKIRQQK